MLCSPIRMTCGHWICIYCIGACSRHVDCLWLCFWLWVIDLWLNSYSITINKHTLTLLSNIMLSFISIGFLIIIYQTPYVIITQFYRNKNCKTRAPFSQFPTFIRAYNGIIVKSSTQRVQHHKTWSEGITIIQFKSIILQFMACGDMSRNSLLIFWFVIKNPYKVVKGARERPGDETTAAVEATQNI